MTTSEALDWMQSNHPTRSASAEKTVWYHAHNQETPRPEPTYSISVQPAFSGKSCEIFNGPSFEDCIEQIQNATRTSVAGEPNNE